MKTKFYSWRMVVVLLMVFALIQSTDTVAIAAGSADKGADKGGGVSAQATAGDVPPIVMTPFNDCAGIKNKVKGIGFFVDQCKLHSDKTINSLYVGASKKKIPNVTGLEKDAKGFFMNEFYKSEAINFISKEHAVFGVEGLEHNIKIRGISKNKNFKTVQLYFDIYIYDYKLDNASFGVFFDKNGAIYGVDFKLPRITPEMYRAVKAAKENVKTLEEIKVLAGRKFIEKGLENGWIRGGTPDEAESLIGWQAVARAGLKEGVLRVIDKAPYIIWKLQLGPTNSTYEYRGAWLLDVNAVTGEIVNEKNINFNEEG